MKKSDVLNTAHDYGVHFVEETLKLIYQSIVDATHLKEISK